MQNYFQSIPISIVLRIYNIFAEDLHVLMHHLTSKQKSSVIYANFLFFFCRSRVIGLDMMENRMVTLCRMIT
jgi:hypothetical protein